MRYVWYKIYFTSYLRRILTDYGFKGYPLRKDFPLMGYVEIVYDDSLQSIKLLSVETAQNFRFFQFNNP